MIAIVGAIVAVIALSCSGVAAEPFPGRQVSIKELRERTSSLVGRDVVVVGVAEAVESITTENFDDWRLVTPCVGSYYVTLKDETGVLDVLMKGNCLLKPPLVNGPWIMKGEKIWMKVTIFVPDLNSLALNPFVRAVAKDYGILSAE